MKLISCEEKSGSFTPANRSDVVQFDNYIFTVESANTDGMIFGKKYETVKVSRRDFEKYCNQPVNLLAGKDVIFERDQNNRLIGVYVLNK